MVDLEALREALALIGGPAGESWAGEFFLVHQAVIDAARALLDAPVADYCEEHDSLRTGDTELCEAVEGELVDNVKSCRSVWVALIRIGDE